MNITKITNYPDGSGYVEVNNDSEIVFKINSYSDLWVLNQVVDAKNNLGIVPTVTIPNLIDAQADRRFKENQSSGLKLVCKFLNSMNAKFRIFHPHNSEVVEALIDNVEIIDNSEFIKKVFYEIGLIKSKEKQIKQQSKITNDLILMSSDAGGFKPLMKLCDKLKWEGDVYSASKSRNSETGELTQIIDRDDFQGKDILIIDDICVYGGTFKGLSKLLREKNCGKIYLAVSHMTVQYLKDDMLMYFDEVFTTNSKYNDYLFKKEKHTVVAGEEHLLPYEIRRNVYHVKGKVEYHYPIINELNVKIVKLF
jgi:ribose-phosphate pyrophosphokinase